MKILGYCSMIMCLASFLGCGRASDDAHEVVKKGIEAEKNGDLDQALGFFDRGIKLQPDSADFYWLRGNVYLKKSQYDRAITDYDKALAIRPQDSLVYASRGDAYRRTGKLDRAIADYTKAIKVNPRDATLYLLRGNIYADTLEDDQAIADFSMAISIEPKNAVGYVGRGNSFRDKGEHDRAIADYTKAISLEPNDTVVYVGRGSVYREKGDYHLAIEDYKKAILMEPNYRSGHAGLAWLLATCPEAKYRDGTKAVESAMRACRLTAWKDASSLTILAAAYAENGQYDKAVKYQLQAMEDVKLIEDVDGERKRLELYKNRKPYREN